MPKSAISKLCGSYMISFIRQLNCFQECLYYFIFLPAEHGWWFPRSSSRFNVVTILILSTLIGNVVVSHFGLNFIFLIAHDAKRLYVLFAVYMCSPVKCLFMSFVHYLDCVIITEFEILIFCWICVLQIFSLKSVACLFIDVF